MVLPVQTRNAGCERAEAEGELATDQPEELFEYQLRPTLSEVEGCVYEVDPLKCPKCGAEMKIISFIEKRQTEVRERILRHCHLWRDKIPRSPQPLLRNTINRVL